MRSIEVGCAEQFYTYTDYRVPNGNGWVIVQREVVNGDEQVRARKGLGIATTNWYVVHAATNFVITAALKKSDAMRIAAELLTKLPKAFWVATKRKTIMSHAPKSVVEWVRQECVAAKASFSK